MNKVNVHTTPPTAQVAAIQRKLAAITQAAQYLQHYSRDAAESQSASGIIRRAREIEALVAEIGARA